METCVKVPKIMLPKKNIDLSKWAVVACDQFTSEPSYWKEVEAYVGNEPSTLNITFPEVYLQKDNKQKISTINQNMKKYISSGVFDSAREGFVLVDRKTPYNEHRLGMIVCIDLECYSYKPEDKALIRATEGTILNRIPPRVEIRQNADLELPHIMLLIDDRKNEVIAPLYAKKEKLEKIYDFELNMKGGHVTGYFIEDTDAVIKSFNKLISKEVLIEKYGVDEKFMFAVGDGNHSLATAKTCWEKKKESLTKEEMQNHPARFALVEVVNLFDEGLKFEPIYRVVFGATDKFEKGLETLFEGEKTVASVITQKGKKEINMSGNSAIATSTLQQYIDDCILQGLAKEVDYVHGIDSVCDVVRDNENSVGITLPALNKEDLFNSVLTNGVLPRKTFSMGEAIEKRYYLETRKISKD